MSQTEKTLNFGDRQIKLIGTAHVSKESCDEVRTVIQNDRPDCVAIELDEQRYKSLNDADGWRKLDIVKVLKNNQGFLLLANLVLAGFQRRMGANVGVKPGDEMRAGIAAAQELNIPTSMVDRPIQITLKRAWAKNSLWGKCKLLSALIASAFSKDEVSGEEIENLKERSEMDGMMNELSDFMPAVKEVLIDERDRYLASHIWECEGKNITAVLGAGHLPGVEKHLNLLAEGKESSNTDDISAIPKGGIWGKVIGWLIPVVIIALIALGYVYGGKEVGHDMLAAWIFWNSSLTGIATLIAGGHPLAILTGIVAAPITSLIPVVGAGMFTGLVQALVAKPKVSDMETLQDDVSTVKGFWKNRILRVLLVFILSSLGSSAGTFIAGAGFLGSMWETVKTACSSAWNWIKSFF